MTMLTATAGRAPRTRLLVLAGVWPHVRQNTEAANVVLHEMLVHLLATGSFDIAFSRMADDDEQSPAAADALRDLEAHGLTVLPSIRVAEPPRPGVVRRIAEVVTASPRALLRGTANAPDVKALCDQWRADCALTVWCESATAALASVPVARVAYYGNPDHKVHRAIWEFDWKFRRHAVDPRGFVTAIKSRVVTAAVERAHLRVMRTFDAVGDVAANDAAFYQRRGVRAFYIRNMWPSGVAADWVAARDRTEQRTPVKIVGNVGSLAATGNTRGLLTLTTSVLPALKRTLGEGNFEVHLFGRRSPHRHLLPLLDDPHIKIRGFVDDLDAEILSAPVFLIANNHAGFSVGHTRFLHAWSLGACVVAFRESAESMPEIVHRRNALLASTPDDMAVLIAEAANDERLRRSMGHGGQATLETQFDPATVTQDVAVRLVASTEARRLSVTHDL